eukprot:6191523-Pleurochrysis_carterae.AAC.4
MLIRITISHHKQYDYWVVLPVKGAEAGERGPGSTKYKSLKVQLLCSFSRETTQHSLYEQWKLDCLRIGDCALAFGRQTARPVLLSVDLVVFRWRSTSQTANKQRQADRLILFRTLPTTVPGRACKSESVSLLAGFTATSSQQGG